MASRISEVGPIPVEELKEIVCQALGLAPEDIVSLAEVTEHSNFNYVFRVTLSERDIFLKLAPEKPKRFEARLPRARIFAEAEALRRFRSLCGSSVVVPEVLFVDRQHFAIGMSDVGQGRRVLLEIIGTHYELLTSQAAPLGQALGAVHSGSRGCINFRPADQDRVIRSVIFDGLLAPGLRALLPASYGELISEMRVRQECLVHADLWGKNILVKEGAPPSLVDFEGAFIGDPAFDIGTLLAVSLIPAIEQPALAPDCAAFARRLVQAYVQAQPEAARARAACARAFRYTGTFLAARGFGPFAYDISDRARERLGALARKLIGNRPCDVEAYADLALHFLR